VDSERNGQLFFSHYSLAPAPLTESVCKYARSFRGLGVLCAGVEAAMVLRKTRFRRCPPTLRGSDVITEHAYLFALLTIRMRLCY